MEQKSMAISWSDERRQLFIGASILLAFYFFGLLGIHWSWMQSTLQYLTPFDSFWELTPLNLLVTTGVMLYFHKDWSPSFKIFLLIAFSVGMIVEILGVATGVIFGVYWYGENLGWKLMGVPYIIGVNWLMLVYASSTFTYHLVQNQWLRPFVAATLMVLIDFLIEPVAIQNDFWYWQGETIPWMNYLAWWGIAFFLCLVFFRLTFQKASYKIPLLVLMCQVVFFFVNGLI